MMKRLSNNYAREDGLETVLEVPIPEEMFATSNRNGGGRSWHNMKSWIRSHVDKSSPPSSVGSRSTELQLLLGVVGAPLIPLPVRFDRSFITRDKFIDRPIEVSMAKYIVQQYIAAAGGDTALNSIKSMCAVGKVKMAASEFSSENEKFGHKGIVKASNKGGRHGHGHGLGLGLGGVGGVGEVGGFVLWHERPGKWCLELVLSGCKISAGSDGNVAWRQTPWHNSHASRGPPRPLRRSLQGLDPRLTANLFHDSICIGERTINEEDCFVLKLETEQSSLNARSGNNVEIIRHSVWGYFSQRTGLLVQLEDSHLLRIKTASDDSVFWETTMESYIHDYRCIDGVNIAHAGRTSVSLFRFGETSDTHSRTRMEEIWSIEEFDFNVEGLSRDFFLPPADLKKDTVKEQKRKQQQQQQPIEEGCGNGHHHHKEISPITANVRQIPLRHRPPSSASKVGCSKVAAVNVDELEIVPFSTQVDDGEEL